jgi:hypothetical protein
MPLKIKMPANAIKRTAMEKASQSEVFTMPCSDFVRVTLSMSKFITVFLACPCKCFDIGLHPKLYLGGLERLVEISCKVFFVFAAIFKVPLRTYVVQALSFFSRKIYIVTMLVYFFFSAKTFHQQWVVA